LQYYPAWYLNQVHGAEPVAIFSAIRQIGQFVLTGAVAIASVLMTHITRTWETRGSQAARQQLSLAFRATSLLLLAGCAPLALLRDQLVRMYAPAYAVGASILPLQLLTFFFGSQLTFLTIHFNLLERTRHVFWSWLVGALMIWLLAALLIGRGMNG